MKSAQVADDQLAQSRQRAEDESRRLASRVTFWSEKAGFVFANRSPDPTVLFLVLSDTGRGSAIGSLGTAPPCTSLHVPGRLMDSRIERMTGSTNEVRGLIVKEPAGAVWERNLQTGALTKFDVAKRGLDWDAYGLGLGVDGLVFDEGSVKRKPIEACGSQ
jgi:hypothetical protein